VEICERSNFFRASFDGVRGNEIARCESMKASRGIMHAAGGQVDASGWGWHTLGPAGIVGVALAVRRRLGEE
jgi:hypothetical protein